MGTMRDDLITEQEAIGLIAPYQALICETADAAWASWLALQTAMPAMTRGVKARTRAGLVNDLWTQGVRDRLANEPGVFINDQRGFLLVEIGGRVVVRFKKLDGRSRSRNYPTHQQLAFVQQIPLEGMPPYARLTAGYRLDASQTAIVDILLTLPIGDRLAWQFSLRRTDGVAYLDRIATTDVDQTPTVRIPRRDQAAAAEGADIVAVNPDMVVLARESRGLSQTDLANRIGVRQATVSKFETDLIRVSEEHLVALARELEYPTSFFEQPDRLLGFASTCVFHRKRQAIRTGAPIDPRPDQHHAHAADPSSGRSGDRRRGRVPHARPRRCWQS